MITNGWRTLVIRSGERLCVRCGSIVVGFSDDRPEQEVPISEVAVCLIESYQASITVPLLCTLLKSGVSVILCDEKHTPFCEIAGVSEHNETAGRILDQAAWTQERKDEIWAEIVRQKIKMQRFLLTQCAKHIPQGYSVMQTKILPGDPENIEGQFARLYFKALFGRRFLRHSYDKENAALDYGYSLLRSTCDRILYSYGYHTAIGIHHCSRRNRFNLSCDLIEPFRPFIDACVWEREMELDQEGKRMLLETLNMPTMYGDKVHTLSDSMELFVLDVMRSMRNSECCIKEVGFVKSKMHSFSVL